MMHVHITHSRLSRLRELVVLRFISLDLLTRVKLVAGLSSLKSYLSFPASLQVVSFAERVR